MFPLFWDEEVKPQEPIFGHIQQPISAEEPEESTSESDSKSDQGNDSGNSDTFDESAINSLLKPKSKRKVT